MRSMRAYRRTLRDAFSVAPRYDLPPQVLAAARIPFTSNPTASGDRYPDLGLWNKPYTLRMPDYYVDQTLYDDPFEGPEDDDIPSFVAGIEARQRDRLVEQGWARFSTLAETDTETVEKELRWRLQAWDQLERLSSDVTPHAALASHLAKKWSAKAIYTLAFELDVRKNGGEEYIKAVTDLALPWLRV